MWETIIQQYFIHILAPNFIIFIKTWRCSKDVLLSKWLTRVTTYLTHILVSSCSVSSAFCHIVIIVDDCLALYQASQNQCVVIPPLPCATCSSIVLRVFCDSHSRWKVDWKPDQLSWAYLWNKMLRMQIIWLLGSIKWPHTRLCRQEQRGKTRKFT